MSVELEARRGLAALGLAASTQVRWNLGVPHLYEAAIANGEATFAAEGPLVARTGAHTGRAPNDKFSALEPHDFKDATVWSDFGAGYGFIPLVLPFVGLWWLVRGSRRT